MSSACDSLKGWIVICLLKGSPPFIVCISYQAPPFTAIPKNDTFSNIAVVRACWSAIICKYKYPLCVFCVFSVCVFCLCFHAVFSLCVFSSLCFFWSSLCFQYVLSVCVFCPCFLSGFAFLSINFDIILLWSGLADQLLFADINSQFIWLQYKYKILTRYFGLSGSPASSFKGKKKDNQMRSKSKAVVQRLVPVKQTLDGTRHWLCLKQCWLLEIIGMLSGTVPLSVACCFFQHVFWRPKFWQTYLNTHQLGEVTKNLESSQAHLDQTQWD